MSVIPVLRRHWPTPCLELAFYCSDKDHQEKQLGKKGLIWLTQPKSHFTEGSHGKTSRRHHGGVLLPGLLSTADLVCFLTDPEPLPRNGTAYSELGSPPIIVQECPTGLPTGHSNRSIFNSSSLFSADSSVHQAEIKKKQLADPI